jgi:triphosphatase
VESQRTGKNQQLGTDHREVEWQFDVPDVRPVRRWLEAHILSGDTSITVGETKELTDTYFDTKDWRLYRAGYALRVRQGDRSVEATMKSLASATGAPPGVRDRRELSEPVEGAKPEALVQAPGTVGGRLRALTGPRALRPIFEIQTRRSLYKLALNGASTGVLALDETTIPPVEKGEEPVCLQRVEVELADGVALSGFESFVEELRAECQLSPAATSKYKAALLACGLAPPGPPSSDRPPWTL